jgi:peptidoglycan/xylan/chitin deacetylase (PgdA/CDA1 family)
MNGMKNYRHIDRKKEYILLAVALILALYSGVTVLIHNKQNVPKPQKSAASQSVSSHASLSLAASSSPSPMDSSYYQKLYPDLYVKKSKIVPSAQDKVAYLTFDDGPSKLTIPLLDVLDRYEVKATFFLVGKTDAANLKAMKKIAERGHMIGVHSYTHQYHQIYATPVNFLEDFKKMHDLILKTTGVDTHIYRFAGGSINSYNKKTAKAIISEMNRRGYTYYDWNVDSGDAEKGTSAQSIYANAVRGAQRNKQSVILFHNAGAKTNTLTEISKIIETLQEQGYHFKILDDSVNNAPYIFKASL